MAKKKVSKAERKIMFAVEEIVLSFVGALVIAFGVLVIGTQFALSTFVLGVFIMWLGLLLFTVPIIRKIEELM